jgi:excinuclease ABC subunit A
MDSDAFSSSKKNIYWTEFIQWKGVLHEAYQRLNNAKSERYRKNLEHLMSIATCPYCKGAKIKPYPAACTIQDQTIFSLTEMELEDLEQFLSSLTLVKEEQMIAQELLRDMHKKLHFFDIVRIVLSILRAFSALVIRR